MNESILKAVENHRVRSEYTQFGWQECNRFEFDETELKAFIGQVVLECARIASNTDLSDVEGGDSAVLRAASEQIKKYFGVQ